MKNFSKISASHYVLPSQILEDAQLFERFSEKKVKAISALSGIVKRRIAPENITALDLGAEAAKRLIESESIKKEDIDTLIFVSQTPDYKLPASAYIAHQRLGLSENCGAFDISLGCSAFPYALAVADGLIASKRAKKILLIFAETITKLIDPADRSLVPLHGDGAAAFILEPSDGTSQIGFTDLGADSSGWEYLIVPNSGARKSDSDKKYLQMNGAAVFHFSISKIPEEIKKSLQKHSAKISDYDLVLLHQANKMMLEEIYKQIDAAASQKFFFLEEIGNLSAASSPVLLAECLRQGRAKNGLNILGAAFGVGLSWGVYSIKFAPNSVNASSASTEF